MGPTWVLSAPDGPHAGPMNLVIREGINVCWYLYLILGMKHVTIINNTEHIVIHYSMPHCLLVFIAINWCWISWTRYEVSTVTIDDTTTGPHCVACSLSPLITRFMGQTWGPSGATGTRRAPCWPHESCYLGRSRKGIYLDLTRSSFVWSSFVAY